jgi:hypothetical protein
VLLALPPAALFFVWLGLLLASFGATVRVIYSNADIVSAPVIGELFPHAPGGAVTTLGFLPWYSTLWFELATHWVPFHRVVWEVGPWLASIAGIALVGWSTVKVAGRWAGWLVTFALVCAGDRLLTIQFASDLHGATVVYVCVLDAFLVLLVLQAGRIGRMPTHVCSCILVAAFAAAGLASDDLLYLAGFVPFVVAGLAQVLCQPAVVGRRIALSVVSIGVVAVVGAEIATAAMHGVHVYVASNRFTFAAWDELDRNFFRLLQSLAELFNGDFGGATIGARSVLTFACALAFVSAVVVATQVGRDELRRLRASQPPITAVREAHVVFWACAVLVTSTAFVFSSFGEISGGRYLVAVGYGIIVLAAVGIAERSLAVRATGVAAACLVVVGSVVALAAGDIRDNSGHYPQQDFASFLATFAQAEGLKYGYASYWVAAPLTWEAKTRVEVYPVLDCSAPAGLCTYPVHEISSWYTPRSDARSFVVFDPRYGPAPADVHLPGSQRAITYGRYTIQVYDHDVAANLGDWRRYGADAS